MFKVLLDVDEVIGDRQELIDSLSKEEELEIVRVNTDTSTGSAFDLAEEFAKDNVNLILISEKVNVKVAYAITAICGNEVTSMLVKREGKWVIV